MPRNRGTNTTLLSSMSSEGMGPWMDIEGSTTKEVFEAYVEHFLAPTLREGQVVMDNLSTHKGENLNPIEEAFSKVQQLLRVTGARTKEALVEVIGKALDVVSASDVRGFFTHCGSGGLEQRS